MGKYYCCYCGEETEIMSMHLVSKVYIGGHLRKPTKEEKQNLHLAKWHAYLGTDMLCPGSEKTVLDNPPVKIGPKPLSYAEMKEQKIGIFADD